MTKSSKLPRWNVSPAIVVWVITAILCIASIIVPNVMRIAAAEDIYSIRNDLLIEAMDYVGACNPESAATVWAEGLRLRNAAMQFSVMNADLRTSYASQLESTFPNWVTGVSSPWIDRYEILKVSPLNETQVKIDLLFTTATSTGDEGNYEASLTIENEGEFWCISSINADDELNIYTGFNV